MQLKVIKSDGSVEVYLHTKVMGAIAAGLGEGGWCQDGLTENLAEAVTMYISRRYQNAAVGTDEIHAMIQAVLSETGYYEAAMALHEHRLTRRIKRSRTTVIYDEGTPGGDFDYKDFIAQSGSFPTGQWDKTVIAAGLEEQTGLSRPMARAVAGAVEEKLLRMDCRQVFFSLVQALVANELWMLRKAELALNEQSVAAEEEIEALAVTG